MKVGSTGLAQDLDWGGGCGHEERGKKEDLEVWA